MNKNRLKRFIIKTVFIKESVFSMKISIYLLKMEWEYKFLIREKFFLEILKMISETEKEILFFGMDQF